MNTKFILKASFNNSSFGEGKLFKNDFHGKGKINWNTKTEKDKKKRMVVSLPYKQMKCIRNKNMFFFTVTIFKIFYDDINVWRRNFFFTDDVKLIFVWGVLIGRQTY